ncbi:hypothetical protein [Kitasatospora cineracea]|uniref:Uncharacterized protein n=1 Tax=Kitasatospora cineracea TaxID=88074 RepID=A0A3N4RV53_9ACTN|nr:hypothetical protein [Kitasatospora cineracea]RPE34705.1 hypothetical protein EDD38_3035 [Kitasatospora cineracea]
MPEQELSDVFVRAVGGSAPDLGPLVAGATAEGRAIRVRRRLALAGAVAAVAALAVGGGLLLRPGAGPGPSAVAAAGPGPGSGLGPGSGGPSAVPAPSVTKARPVVLDRLLVFVPDLVLDGWSEEGSTADGTRTDTVRARFRTASGADAGTVEVRVQQPGGASRDTGESYDCRDHRDTEECAPVTGKDTDGVLLALSDQQHRTAYRADLLDHRGVRTVLTATGPEGGDPPLDRDRLAKAAAGLTALPGTEEERARESARQRALTADASPPAATGPSAFPSAAPSATRPPNAADGGAGGPAGPVGGG